MKKDLLDIFIHKVKQPLNNMNLILYSMKEEIPKISDIELTEQMVHQMNYTIESFKAYLKFYGKKIEISELNDYLENEISDNRMVEGVLLPLVQQLKEVFVIEPMLMEDGGLVILGQDQQSLEEKWKMNELETVNMIILDYLEGTISLSDQRISIDDIGV